MNNICNFAYQLSKINGNIRYDFGPEYNEMKDDPRVGLMTRRLSDFFDDAHRFVGLFSYEEPYEKVFSLDFANMQLLEKVMSKFLNMGYDENHHLTVDIDEENKKFRLHVIVYDDLAFDFIFGKGTNISIRRLSKLFKTKIKFSYELRSEIPIECNGVADSGEVNVDFKMNFHELNDLDEIHTYMLEVAAFLDIVPRFELLNKIKPKLSKKD